MWCGKSQNKQYIGEKKDYSYDISDDMYNQNLSNRKQFWKKHIPRIKNNAALYKSRTMDLRWCVEYNQKAIILSFVR